MEILRCDRYVREKFGLPFRGGEMLQPWFIGQRELPVKGRVKLTFGFDVEVLPEQPIKLVMEEPERFETCINGERLEGLCDGFFWRTAAISRMKFCFTAETRQKRGHDCHRLPRGLES